MYGNSYILKFNLKEDGPIKILLKDCKRKIVKKIVNCPMTVGNPQLTLETPNLPKGIYFYSVGQNTILKTIKILIIN